MDKKPKTDAELIAELGGPAKVAELLGYDKHGTQRVSNWLTRGIPAKVKLERPDLFLSARYEADAPSAQEPRIPAAEPNAWPLPTDRRLTKRDGPSKE